MFMIYIQMYRHIGTLYEDRIIPSDNNIRQEKDGS